MNSKFDKLVEIFSKKNMLILEYIASKESHIRQIAEDLKVSPATVHKAIILFKKLNLVKEQRKKNLKIINLNTQSSLLAQIRALVNQYKLSYSKAYKKLKKFGNIGVYGSFAKGTDDVGSDIDIWVYTENGRSTKLRMAIRQLEKELGKPVSLLILNKKKLERFQKSDKEFYIRLKLTSINLSGGDIFD